MQPELIWVERRLLSVWQDRLGPNRVGPFGLGQVIADTIKLFFKEDWVPPFSDRPVFVLAPGILMITILLTFAVVPFGPDFYVFDSNIGVLFFLGNSSLGVYSIVLGGWASNNKYSLIGAMRASAQMLTYEVFMGLSFMGVVMMADSLQLSVKLSKRRRGGWFFIPQFIGFVVFFIAGIAETHRLPFDIPEAEGELIAGYHSEYSGMKFGMFFVGEYLGSDPYICTDLHTVFWRLARDHHFCRRFSGFCLRLSFLSVYSSCSGHHYPGQDMTS